MYNVKLSRNNILLLIGVVTVVVCSIVFVKLNSEEDATHYSIGESHAFYVDFVIRMNDGGIGLFDPKKGFTAKIAKPKAEALSTYLRLGHNGLQK